MARARSAKKQKSRARYRFTKDDCRRGYQAALQKCMESWDLLAWFVYKLRGHYRRKANGP